MAMLLLHPSPPPPTLRKPIVVSLLKTPSSSSSSSSSPPNPSTSSSLARRTNLLFSAIAESQPLDRALALFRLLPARDAAAWNAAISACLRRRRPAAALRLFLDMLLSPGSASAAPDPLTLRSVLNACSNLNDLDLLIQIHSYVIKTSSLHSFSSEITVLYTHLLNLYAKFGLVEVARKLFDEIPDIDVVAFTSLLARYGESGRQLDALRLYQEIVKSDYTEMNAHTYSCALRACVSIRALFEGRQIHAQIVKLSMGSDVFVGTGLVDLYVKCGEMECAMRAFLEIEEPSVVSWNSLMAGDLGGEECFQLFAQMQESGLSPDHVTFACVLRSLKDADLSAITVRQFHGLIVKMMDMKLDVFVSTALFEAYIDHSCDVEAQRVLAEMEEKDDATFNVVIQGCLRNGYAAKAVDAFFEALKVSAELREATVSMLLRAIGLYNGTQVHALVIKRGCCNSSSGASVLSSLIRMYAEHRCLDKALRLFEQIHSPDVVQWTSLIAGFSQSGESHEALKLYVRMLSDELGDAPNHYTFSTLLTSCAELGAGEEGKQIHAQITKAGINVSRDKFVSSSLLYMYASCGYIGEASRLFDKMPQRDLASWNAMINSLSQHGYAQKALEMFHELLNKKNMQPNHITYIGVLTACNRGGMVEKGYKYFKSIEKPTIDHYACLIDMFGRAGRLKEAMSFVEEMPFQPNELIWTSLLAASSMHGNIELGEYSAKQLLKLNPKDPGTYVALSNIYAASRRWKDMKEVRRLMESQADRKQAGVSWVRSKKGQKYVFSADKRS
ncbi:Pentatricopeptide repeat-containing protein [Ananas comosus]|uniref:Pentatricopeptide repeat-containing protein n=1 Tax=Ananas comosus TaxID=4615 RepID=A0A199VYF1_ANACO|nr:Pentatricopeptide repeat-containing protein [Ananas comosus]